MGRSVARALITCASVALLALPTAPAAATRRPDVPPRHQADRRTTTFDVRSTQPALAPAVRTTRAEAALAARLGPEGVVSSDPRTGTIRFLADRDGFLTQPSSRRPTAVALGYVRSHLPAFGLDPADLDTLSLARDYVDILGTHHLLWRQTVGGIPVFDDDLRAAVTNDGRLLMVGGAPVHGLSSTTVPWVSAWAALSTVRSSVHAPPPGRVARASSAARRETVFAGGDAASLVLFQTGAGTRLAWQVLANVAPDARYRAVVDARTGELLYRTNLVRFDDVQGSGLAWDYYPSDLVPNGGGSQHPVAFPVADATKLKGNNAWVMKNLNGSYRTRGENQIPASGPGPSWTFPAALDTTTASENCSPHFACTWNSRVPYSWQANVEQNAVQLYSYLNAYHDHLLAAPIGFTEAAGNFQQVNTSGQGLGGDPIIGWADTCADGGDGLPCFTFNAFIYVPPDGYSPEASMLLFDPATGASLGNPDVPAGNAGDDASVVYHEYTHGLSNRLVIDAQGFSELNSYQSYSMGEAWSDWYALDFLAAQGFQVDTPAPGEVATGYYIQGGHTLPVRTEPMDCPVGTLDPACPGGASSGSGGYTFGNICDIGLGCEPHADGEIWSQTLWDLRTELGSAKTEMLVTRAMELSPPGPSFLDMRDAIFLADRVAFGGADTDTLWSLFANRGMGFWAESNGGDDLEPAEDFSLPPTCPDECTSVDGVVTDAETGAPLDDVIVTLAPGEYTTTTDRSGAYRLRNVGIHTYSRLVVSHRGYESTTIGPIDVTEPTSVDASINIDWASTERGGSIGRFSGPNYHECGPRGMLDLGRTFGWVTRPTRHVHVGRFANIRLPKAVDISSFGLDPGPTCFSNYNGYAVAHFAIYTSRTGVRWVLAFERHRPLPVEHMSTLVPSAGTRNVRYVRLVIYTARGRNAFLIEVAEISVRGTPA